MPSVGLQIEPQFGFTYAQVRDLARLCRAVGFNSLWCSDHLFLDAKSEDRNCYDAWQLLSALAVETEGIRLGTLVTCVSFRYPSVLAKLAAGVDALSGGRLELGIGAGWKELEYRAYGIPFPSPGQRVSQLEEAIQIVKAMWTQRRATFKGRYYQVQDAFCQPKPVQKPHPRIWVGGSQPRVLRIAARHAHGINVGGFPSVQRYKEVLDVLKKECQVAGRDFGKFGKSHFMPVAVAESKPQMERILESAARNTGRTLEEETRWRERGFIGSPEGLAERLKEYAALGVTQFMLVFPYGYEAEGVKLVAEKTLPRL